MIEHSDIRSLQMRKAKKRNEKGKSQPIHRRESKALFTSLIAIPKKKETSLKFAIDPECFLDPLYLPQVVLLVRACARSIHPVPRT